MVSNWPPALQAALARWGATQGKSPALTALDITGKPLYTLTYGEARETTEESVTRRRFRCSSCQQDNTRSHVTRQWYPHPLLLFLPHPPLHLLSIRETVESQCETGVHPSEQAWHQERTNPQTWRPGEGGHTHIHTHKNRKSSCKHVFGTEEFNIWQHLGMYTMYTSTCNYLLLKFLQTHSGLHNPRQPGPKCEV